MTATIINMDYRLVDVLNADQLEVGDLIGFGDEVVKILSITPIKDGYALSIENDFNEKDLIDIKDDEQFELFLFSN